MPSWYLLSLFLLLVLSTFSCTRIPKGEEQVASLIECKTGQEIYWNQGGYEDSRVQAYIQDLISQPLTPESVVQIALLNNPHIQATFEELGIAQADFVAAGLLSNPSFEIDVRYPPDRRFKTNIEYFITASFLDIFLIPLRTRIAAAEFEQTKFKVANDILSLAFEVRQTYYELLAEKQMLTYIQAIAELTSIQGEIAARQKLVDNINQLDFQQMQAQVLEAELKIARSQIDIIRLREKLNRLLGLCEDRCYFLPKKIPEEIDYQGFDFCALTSIAFAERLDWQVARLEVIRLSRLLGIKQWWAYSLFRTGIAGEQDWDGMNLIGPGFSGEIPLFNYGQADRMRLFAQLRQAQDRLAALEVRIRSEVREAHQLLLKELKMIVDYRLSILPLQNHIVDSSEELYNVMGLGIDRLLENKRQQLETYRGYLDSLKNYWIARVQLDKALGGYLFRILTQDNDCEGAIE